MSEILISIITPCYNQGQYLDDAIESISEINTPYTYEHIIINDGSTDIFTINKINQLEKKGYKVINQKNMGLAHARNNAIAKAKGKYIIPLDADNKLSEAYLIDAIDVLERDQTITVVYADALFFGNENRYFKNEEFDIYKMLDINHIDACAVIRKEFLDKTNGYDTNMPGRGCEDWELWLSIFFKGGTFYYLNKLGFYYRVTDSSMRLTISPLKGAEDRKYMIHKNADALLSFFKQNYWKINYLKNKKLKGAINILLGRLF